MNSILGRNLDSRSPWDAIGRRLLRAGVLMLSAFSASVLPGMASASESGSYPDKPVRLIIPFAPGGATDITARLIGEGLSQKWGQPVIMENRAGAGGTVGAGMVAKAEPDGYTLVLGVTGSNGIAGSLYENLSYDPKKDFEPVSRVVSYANAILVADSVPAKNLQELIALIKRDPSYRTYGADGNGTASHLTMELLKHRAGFEDQAVQYKGSGPLLTDLAGGFIKVGITGLPAADALLKDCKIKLIAVTTERDYTGQGYASIAEQGFPGFQAAPWSGIFAPKGTPKAIVEKISKDIAEVVSNKTVKERFAELGMTVQPTTPEQFREELEPEMAKWAEAVRLSGAKVQ